VRTFWPIAESGQADYEELRASAAAETPPLTLAHRRFEQSGLAGLICAPSAVVVFHALIVGAERPAWEPYADPRDTALAESYGLLLGVEVTESVAIVGDVGHLARG
jgi:hypothetical protein